MSVATRAMNNFSVWRERQQARQDHERLETEETADEHPLQEDQEGAHQELTTQQQPPSSPSDTTPILVETVSEENDSDEEVADVENQRGGRRRVSLEQTPDTTSVTVIRERPGRRTISLADLEEERMLARRRTSMCVLLAVFILFRLWVQAVATGDFFLLLLCLVGTSWTTKFIRHTREREEALDRLIQEYSSEGNDGGLFAFEVELSGPSSPRLNRSVLESGT